MSLAVTPMLISTSAARVRLASTASGKALLAARAQQGLAGSQVTRSRHDHCTRRKAANQGGGPQYGGLVVNGENHQIHLFQVYGGERWMSLMPP